MIVTEELRIVHIRNTRCLEKLSVSRAYLPDIQANPSLRICDDWQPMAFGHDGNMVSPFGPPRS